MINEDIERCVYCKYCHKLKDLVDGEWVIKSVCTVFPQIEKNSTYDDFAIVVNSYDMCEMWCKRD